MQAKVEECDLSLVSLARPAIELRRFKCKVSANRAHTQWVNEICLALTKTCDKNCLSQIFNFLIVGPLESSKIFVDRKESIKWRNKRSKRDQRVRWPTTVRAKEITSRKK